MKRNPWLWILTVTAVVLLSGGHALAQTSDPYATTTTTDDDGGFDAGWLGLLGLFGLMGLKRKRERDEPYRREAHRGAPA